MTIKGRDETEAIARYGACHFALSEKEANFRPWVEANYAILTSGALLAWSDDAAHGDRVAEMVAFSADLNPRIAGLLEKVCADLHRRGRGYGQCPRKDPFTSVKGFCYLPKETYDVLSGRAIATWMAAKQCVARSPDATLAFPDYPTGLSLALEIEGEKSKYIEVGEHQRSIKLGIGKFNIWNGFQTHFRYSDFRDNDLEESFAIDIDTSLPIGPPSFNRILDFAAQDCFMQARALFQLLVGRTVPSPLTVRDAGGVVRLTIKSVLN